MKKLALVVASGLVGSFALVGPSFGAAKGFSSNYDEEGKHLHICDGAAKEEDAKQYIDYEGVTNAWPPNHKEEGGTVHAVDLNDQKPSAGTPTVTVTGTSDDEFNAEDFGGGVATDGPDDADDGVASADIYVIRERNGTATAGRTYTIRADATFAGNAKCTAFFCVQVPHDMSKDERSQPCDANESFVPPAPAS